MANKKQDLTAVLKGAGFTTEMMARLRDPEVLASVAGVLMGCAEVVWMEVDLFTPPGDWGNWSLVEDEHPGPVDWQWNPRDVRLVRSEKPNVSPDDFLAKLLKAGHKPFGANLIEGLKKRPTLIPPSWPDDVLCLGTSYRDRQGKIAYRTLNCRDPQRSGYLRREEHVGSMPALVWA